MLIFAGDETKVVHERVTGAAAAGGKIILSAKRSSFAENVGYWVYLVANSTEESEAFDALTNLNGLKAMQQRDPNIHMTGIASLPDIPQTFLMDGLPIRATANRHRLPQWYSTTAMRRPIPN